MTDKSYTRLEFRTTNNKYRMDLVPNTDTPNELLGSYMMVMNPAVMKIVRKFTEKLAGLGKPTLIPRDDGSVLLEWQHEGVDIAIDCSPAPDTKDSS